MSELSCGTRFICRNETLDLSRSHSQYHGTLARVGVRLHLFTCTMYGATELKTKWQLKVLAGNPRYVCVSRVRALPRDSRVRRPGGRIHIVPELHCANLLRKRRRSGDCVDWKP